MYNYRTCCHAGGGPLQDDEVRHSEPQDGSLSKCMGFETLIHLCISKTTGYQQEGPKASGQGCQKTSKNIFYILLMKSICDNDDVDFY